MGRRSMQKLQLPWCTKSLIWGQTIAICLLANSAHAEQTAQQIDTLLAELAAARAQVAQLTSENVKLRAGIMQDAANDAMIDLSDTSEGCHRRRDSCSSDDTSRCRGKCYMSKKKLDKHCKMTDSYMTKIQQKVTFVGTKESPAWSVNSGMHGENSVGIVRCPCTGLNGTTLTSLEATKKIVGEIASIGIPDWMAKAVLTPNWLTHPKYAPFGKGPWWGVAWNARIALAAVKMVDCWKVHCSKAPKGATLDDLLDTSDGWGGGVAC